MTADFKREINIYCDESRHTSDPDQPYMVIGAISCPRDQKQDLYQTIYALRNDHNIWREVGWKTLSPNKFGFYRDLIDFFYQTGDLSFRCLVVDKTLLDHEKFNYGDQELGFYKLYYQMLIHWLERDCKYHIFLDWQQNKQQGRFTDLRSILQRKLSGKTKIATLEPVESKHQQLVQLCDLFIGAVGYSWNNISTSDTKLEFCRLLAEGADLKSFKSSTPWSERKFNIFHFSGKNSE